MVLPLRHINYTLKFSQNTFQFLIMYICVSFIMSAVLMKARRTTDPLKQMEEGVVSLYVSAGNQIKALLDKFS